MSKALKVLHVSAGNMFGGVESIMVTLARSSADCPEMESSFAVCFDGRFSLELRAAGAKVHHLGEVRASRFWTVRSARQRLLEILPSYDLAVCHMPWNHAVFAPVVKKAGKPLVFWQHGPAAGRGWIEAWARRTRPDFAICNSNFTAKTLPLLFGDTPSGVLYCPVSMPSVKPAEALALRNELGASKDAVVIAQVGRMEALKGHSLHLKALAELKDLPEWICWMVGGAQKPDERAYVEQLKQQAERLGIAGRVRFLGQRSDVATILAAADIFCQPNEGVDAFGIVFIEALAAGLPVVTTRIGGGAEIVTENEGCLVEPGDAHQLAQRLRELVTSPEQRRAKGRRGPARAESLCDPATQVTELHRTLARLVSTQGDAGAMNRPRVRHT